MTNEFFHESAQIKKDISKRIQQVANEIPHKKLKEIINQKNKTSSFLKGIISYLIHEGVGGNFSKKDKIELATAIEVLCSSGAIFDNAIDNHEERNGETTYLKEYGPWMQIAASQYALHHGLKMLFPFMGTYIQKFSNMYSIDEAVLGMVGMDIEKSKSLEEQLKITERSNGKFAEVPLVIAATTGNDNEAIIKKISRYGFNLGSALGIYEEVRDMLGKHGRRRASEIEGGRFAIPLHMVNELKGFNLEKYVGRTIDDAEYSTIIKKVIESGAMRGTQNLALSYFDKARESLSGAVEKVCFQKLDSLPRAVCSEFESIIAEAERKYN